MIDYHFLLQHNIQNSAKKFPERPAFRCGDEEVTYLTLYKRMNQISNMLLDNGLEKQDRVGILMNRCLETTYSIYGIMNAGGIYVPLDAKAPSERINFLIQDCNIKILLTTKAVKRKLLQIDTEHLKVVAVDEVLWQENVDFFCPFQILEDDPAYILYTSGSTGTPKGIVHTHRSGLGYARLVASTYHLSHRDRIANHAPIFFDISTLGYFAGPLAGSCTVLVTDAHTIMPASLATLISSEKISVWYSVPLALIQMLESGLIESKDYSSLRWVLYAGEAFPVKHLRLLMQKWSHAQFCNIYGPTETNQCTHHIFKSIPELDDDIPIGMVWDNTEFLIKDGELLIRSVSNMQGYWNNAPLTEKSFYCDMDSIGSEIRYYKTGDLVELRSDKLLYLIGRRDHQIKIRGFRVELGEVEEAIMKFAGIREVAVVTQEKDGRHENIISFVKVSEPIDVNSILKFVKKQVPHYAVPSAVHILDEFPRTANGKVNRNELKSIYTK